MVPESQLFLDRSLVGCGTEDLRAVLLHLLTAVAVHVGAMEKGQVECGGDGASPEAALHVQCAQPVLVVWEPWERGCAPAIPVGVEVCHECYVKGWAGFGRTQLHYKLGLCHPKRRFLLGIVVFYGESLGAYHSARCCV